MYRAVALAAAAVFSTSLAGGGAAFEPPESHALTLATGSASGVYFPLGSAMAAIWSRQIEGLAVTAETSFASVVNMQLIDSGEADLALVQNDIAAYAGSGEAMFESTGPLEGAVGLAMLYPEMIQIVTLAGSGIERVEDLAGKRVAVGAVGSGTERNAHRILDEHGLGYERVHAYFLSFAEAVVSLRDGTIHAAFLTAGVPTRAITDLRRKYELDVALVPLDPDKIGELASQSSFFEAALIPAGSYAGMEEDVPTLAVVAMLVGSRDLDAHLVEQMLDTLFRDKNLRRLCGAHPRGCDISVDTALTKMPLRLHPGAESFFARQVSQIAAQ